MAVGPWLWLWWVVPVVGARVVVVASGEVGVREVHELAVGGVSVTPVGGPLAGGVAELVSVRVSTRLTPATGVLSAGGAVGVPWVL